MQSATARQDSLVPDVVVLDVRHRSMKNYNYLVVDPATRLSVIVDPAWELEKVTQAIADSNSRLSGVLLTHSHHDHIDLAERVSEQYDCPIWMSNTEIAASGFRAKRLVGIDTEPWQVGELLIEPLFTPGHTAGSTCYVIGDNLFTGDVLFAEGAGICRDVPAAHAMFGSLELLKRRIPPRVRVFPGHSYGQPPGRPMSQLLRDNIYLQFTDKESFTAFRLRGGQDKARQFSFA
jgi:hydroxyacylglutathione hydrolase